MQDVYSSFELWGTYNQNYYENLSLAFHSYLQHIAVVMVTSYISCYSYVLITVNITLTCLHRHVARLVDKFFSLMNWKSALLGIVLSKCVIYSYGS